MLFQEGQHTDFFFLITAHQFKCVDNLSVIRFRKDLKVKFCTSPCILY